MTMFGTLFQSVLAYWPDAVNGSVLLALIVFLAVLLVVKRLHVSPRSLADWWLNMTAIRSASQVEWHPNGNLKKYIALNPLATKKSSPTKK